MKQALTPLLLVMALLLTSQASAAPQEVAIKGATLTEIRTTLFGSPTQPGLASSQQPFEAKFQRVVLTRQDTPQLIDLVRDTTASLPPGSEMKIQGTIDGRPFEAEVEKEKGRTEVKLEGLTFANQQQVVDLLNTLNSQGVREVKLKGVVNGRRIEAEVKERRGRREVKLEGVTFASQSEFMAQLNTSSQNASRVKLEGFVNGRQVEAQAKDGKVKIEGLTFSSREQVDQVVASLQQQGFREVKVEGFVGNERIEAKLKEGKLKVEAKGRERDRRQRGKEGVSSSLNDEHAKDRGKDDRNRHRGREEKAVEREGREKHERDQDGQREKAEKRERLERKSRDERSERLERTEHPDRRERVERIERVERD